MPTKDYFSRPISELTDEEITEVLIKWVEDLESEIARVFREHGWRKVGGGP